MPQTQSNGLRDTWLTHKTCYQSSVDKRFLHKISVMHHRAICALASYLFIVLVLYILSKKNLIVNLITTYDSKSRGRSQTFQNKPVSVATLIKI